MSQGQERLKPEFLVTISEDCTDCFGTQKKDEPNDKEKKEEEETSASVHHSIIETWDWGRQPGETATPEVKMCRAAKYPAALSVSK